MISLPRLGGPVRLGLALAPDRLTVVELDQRKPAGSEKQAYVRPLEPWDGGAWRDLEEALGELAIQLDVSRAEVFVALLPPLVELKRLELPPLRLMDVERVLTRDAGRYFLDGSGRRIVGAVRLRSDAGRGRSVLAAAAAADLVEQLHRGALRIGWSIARVVPAQCAWAALAARTLGSLEGKGRLVHLGGESVDVLDVERPDITGIRRLPPDSNPSGVAAVVGAPPGGSQGESSGPLVVLGDPAAIDRLYAALPSRGGHESDARASLGPADPGVAAARFARFAAGPRLIPDTVAAKQRRLARAVTRSALAASLAFLAAAAGFERIGLDRELDRVTTRREVLSARVARTMAVRDAVEAVSERARAIESARLGARRWSETLGAVAAALPDDAHLVAWQAVADSLRVEGLAGRANGVFESLARASGVEGVRAEAPVRQESRDSGPPIERFLLGARLAGTSTTGEAP